MSKQLTMGDILKYVAELKRCGMTLSEINKLPVYIGDDDELNGIHCSWYCEMITNDIEDYKYIREMINEDRNNIKLADDAKAILIS